MIVINAIEVESADLHCIPPASDGASFHPIVLPTGRFEIWERAHTLKPGTIAGPWFDEYADSLDWLERKFVLLLQRGVIRGAAAVNAVDSLGHIRELREVAARMAADEADWLNAAT